MNIIRRHPFAAWNLAGFALAGISLWFILSDLSLTSEVCMALSTLGFLAACVMLPVVWVVGIIRCVKGEGGQVRSNYRHRYIRELACEYMSRKPFAAVYGLLILLLSPITPLVLIHVLDVFSIPLMFIGTGLMILLAVCTKDFLAAAFFRRHGTEKHFNLLPCDGTSRLDRLYGGYVHTYLEHSWDGMTRDFIYNLLLREKALNGTIHCCRVSTDFLHEKYGCRKNGQISGYILVPFSSFELNAKNGQTVRKYLDCISSGTLNSLLNSRYGRKDSLEPADYAHRADARRLSPCAARLSGVQWKDGELRMAISEARNPAEPCHHFYDCLLILRDVTVGEESGQLLRRMETADRVHLFGFRQNSEEGTLSMTVIIDDDIDAENWTQDEEEYSPEQLLECRFGEMEWHYDGFCDTTEYANTLRRISKNQTPSE